MEERRKQLRIEEPFKVTYKIVSEIICRTRPAKNISTGGVSLSIVHPLDPGVLLHLWIRLKDFKHPIPAIGKVIWQKDSQEKDHPYLIGVQFVQIDPNERKVLSNQIRSICEKLNIPFDDALE